MLGNDFEVVFAKENVLKAHALVVAAFDAEAIAKIASLAKGHRESLEGLSRRSLIIPGEFDWERVAVPFSSARKLVHWVASVAASVFKVGFLGFGVDLFRFGEIGGDGEAVLGHGWRGLR